MSASEEGAAIIALLPCAGVGSRLPGAAIKELYRVGGRPMIDYTIEAARYAGANRFLLVVAPGKEAVAHHVALAWNVKSLMTVYQYEPLGTGHALAVAADVLKENESVLYLMPDSVFDPASFAEALTLRSVPTSVMLWPTNRPTEMGCFAHDNGHVVAHVEKQQPPWPGPYLAWGAAVLSHRFVEYCREAWHSGDWVRHALTNRGSDKEFTIDDAFDYVLMRGQPVGTVEVAGPYYDCGTPEGVDDAEAWLRNRTRMRDPA